LTRFLNYHLASSRASKKFLGIANILFALISSFAVVFVEVANLAIYVVWIVRDAMFSGREIREAISVQARLRSSLKPWLMRTDGILNPTDITTFFQGKRL